MSNNNSGKKKSNGNDRVWINSKHDETPGELRVESVKDLSDDDYSNSKSTNKVEIKRRNRSVKKKIDPLDNSASKYEDFGDYKTEIGSSILTGNELIPEHIKKKAYGKKPRSAVQNTNEQYGLKDEKKAGTFGKGKQALQRAMSRKSIKNQTNTLKKSLKRFTIKGSSRYNRNRKTEDIIDENIYENGQDSDESSFDSDESIEGVNEVKLPTSNSYLSDPSSVKAIVTAIRVNNKFNNPYFQIQSSVLIACLPSRTGNSASEITNARNTLYNQSICKIFGQKYISDYKRFGGANSAFAVSNVTKNLEYNYIQRIILKRPHIYKMVTDAFFHLRRLKQNQLFVLSGISGSGKSSSENDILTQISYLSNKGSVDNKKVSYLKIDAISSIIEAFASATTKESFSSTRCGYWREVQLSSKGRIIGHKLITFGHDRWRTTEPPIGERNFNIFYYLIYGSNASMLTKLNLSADELKYNYLQSDPDLIPSENDSIESIQNIETFKYHGIFPNDISSKSEAIKHHKKICIAMYDNTVTSLVNCGINFNLINSIFQLLGAILHLGNCEFVDLVGVSESASSKNRNELEATARLLGVSSRGLETTLTYKTTVIGGELCTVFMSSFGAARQRDELARLLYHLMFMWLIDTINKTSNNKNSVNQFAILNMYGAGNCQRYPSYSNKNVKYNIDDASQLQRFENFVVNLTNEKVFGFVLNEIFDENSGINFEMKKNKLYSKKVPYKNHLEASYLLVGRSTETMGGLVKALENHATNKDHSSNDMILLRNFTRNHSDNINFIINSDRNNKHHQLPTFGVNHFFGIQNYMVDGFSKHNSDQLVSTDFISLFQQSSRNRFMQIIFGVDFIRMFLNPNKETNVLEAHVTSNFNCNPTIQLPDSLPLAQMLENIDSDPVDMEINSNGEKDNEGVSINTKKKRIKYITTELEPVDSSSPPVTQVAEVNSALNNIFASASNYKTWHIFHIKPTPVYSSGEISHYLESGSRKLLCFNPKFVEHQIVSFAIPEISYKRSSNEFSLSMDKNEFIIRYINIYKQSGSLVGGFKLEINDTSTEEEDKKEQKVKIEQILESFGWKSGVDYILGESKIFMCEDSWQEIELVLISREKNTRNPPKNYHINSKSGLNIDFSKISNKGLDSETSELSSEKSKSRDYDSDSYLSPSNDSDAESTNENPNEDSDGEEHYGRDLYENQHHLENDYYENESDWDIEKYDEKIETFEEIPTSKSRKYWVMTTNSLTFWIPKYLMNKCGIKRPDVQLAWREKVAICIIICLLWFVLLFFIIGLGLIMCPRQYVYGMNEIGVHVTKDDAYIALRGVAYDITNFVNVPHGLSRGGAVLEDMLGFSGMDVNGSFPIPIRSACDGLVSDSVDPDNSMFLKSNPEVDGLFPFIHKPGMKIGTELPDQNFYFKYFLPKMRSYRKGDIVWNMDYLNHLHYKKGKYWRVLNGEVFNFDMYFETKNAIEYTGQKKWSFLDPTVEAIIDDGGARSTDISNYWMKMKLTSLQLSPRRKPQKHDKFVICQVPCYTEGEESLRKTIEGLAVLNYEDKHKLLFIICDGNIVGSGNTKPTPRIVLDILGVDSKQDPSSLSFRSIGDGSKQHNMAKVYSGLFQHEGHSVPFIVVAKVGKPSEKSRPGNRGKRDSQMILLHFLNRSHNELPMSPLDLEIYHQMKNVIGIHPSMYEYVLMVDADTVVSKDSLNRLIACMVYDGKILGICGETRISNEDKSWATMIQVYEYFISHNMAKAFESIFGSVTCLPGCFSLYRIKNLAGDLLIASDSITKEYSENIVDTLHKKNLLSLGEDRYLTTLALKYFPQYKTTFTSDAVCETVVPDSFSVLLSQRRRWINSTVHNLIELVFLPELCGFCFFSMRFVVFIDLFGTLTMPCTVLYLLYLAYLAISKTSSIGYISLILIGVIYGLQVILFVIKRQWQHIGWLVIYLFAYPLWSLYIPIYSFWHFDDFSWGNTRIVVGEDGKRQIVISDDEKFNPSDIPMRTWSEHEDGLLEKHQLLYAMGNMVRDYDAGLDLDSKAGISNRHVDFEMQMKASNNAPGSFYSNEDFEGPLSSRAATPAYPEALIFNQNHQSSFMGIRAFSPISHIGDNMYNNGGYLQQSAPGYVGNDILINQNGLDQFQAPQRYGMEYNTHQNSYTAPNNPGMMPVNQSNYVGGNLASGNEYEINPNLNPLNKETPGIQNLQAPNFFPNAFTQNSNTQQENNILHQQQIAQQQMQFQAAQYLQQQQVLNQHHLQHQQQYQTQNNQQQSTMPFNNYDINDKSLINMLRDSDPKILAHLKNDNDDFPQLENNSNLVNGQRTPSDEEILFQIRVILSQVDLNFVTIKKVRMHLEQLFGCDLSHKKTFIKNAIQEIIKR
ncbi:Chitin synthase 6 [Smittium culicis]|uniref:chitin synthase n=1 Tax=Smittium culicis TaxID=133412 RepID=A0A1R1YKC6_9FUNG|nr:Chitin synthase 6 [Smittium culicis]